MTHPSEMTDADMGALAHAVLEKVRVVLDGAPPGTKFILALSAPESTPVLASNITGTELQATLADLAAIAGARNL